jgi:hypothetical protein
MDSFIFSLENSNLLPENSVKMTRYSDTIFSRILLFSSDLTKFLCRTLVILHKPVSSLRQIPVFNCGKPQSFLLKRNFISQNWIFETGLILSLPIILKANNKLKNK